MGSRHFLKMLNVLRLGKYGRVFSTSTLRLEHTTSVQRNKWATNSIESLYPSQERPLVIHVLPTAEQTIKVLFDNHKTADFKNVWLRDNCACPKCLDRLTRQKMLDTPSLDITAKPTSVQVSATGNLVISWREGDEEHVSTFNSDWLYRYGQSFMHDTFESSSAGWHPDRPPPVLWDKAYMERELPEMPFEDFMHSDDGLKRWLEMVCKYGIAILRNVPTEQNKILDVVKRFAYVKETQYGLTFDVVNEPDPTAHPAFSGLHLHHHTDMNYREKSPGLQLLHCLKAHDTNTSAGAEIGGMSFFVDGFKVATWMKENEPLAFQILASTPIRFQIQNSGKHYSQLWPIICTSQEGDVTEIHYNNRTMGPLQAPSHVVVPFYYAYKLFSKKVREEAAELRFNMVAGDLVAFNNRRILHGRTSFDPQRVLRHLVGCYVDFDEVESIYNALLVKR